MTEKAKKIIDFLSKNHYLTEEEYLFLIKNRNEEMAEYLRQKADEARKNIYANKVFIRGLIEISNICKNDCYYCGIRSSNKNCERYKLSEKDILSCCENGYKLGFRTFVLQGGEGVFPIDFICDIVKKIKEKYPDSAVTLSLGEYQKSDYEKMKNAGADRYLLRHETICKAHYEKLHPQNMSFDNRLRCLNDLKELKFQVGSGFLVGSPYQSEEIIAKEFKFIEEFSPQMCGIGPFIPQKDTPFKDEKSGTAEETAYYLSIIRLIKPNILLPATTALGTIKEGGRELGIISGANVVMPNLSPETERKKYALYDNKLATGVESAEQIEKLKMQMQKIGYEIVCDRGDIKE
ncbi:MAG: [Clostridia bacterium]|nr:[FeFe] hydrogenase H-cluster radical SAM maturase HydE [Clostridia bacterium]